MYSGHRYKEKKTEINAIHSSAALNYLLRGFADCDDDSLFYQVCLGMNWRRNYSYAKNVFSMIS